MKQWWKEEADLHSRAFQLIGAIKSTVQQKKDKDAEYLLEALSVTILEIKSSNEVFELRMKQSI